MHDDTRAVTAGRDPAAHHGAVNTPVYRVSTVLFPTVAAMDAAQAARDAGEQVMVYGRTGTPTSFGLENAIAELEGGYRCQTFPSGLSAVSSALTAFLKAGDHLLMTDSTYGPTRVFCDTVLSRFGVSTTYYDPLVGAGIAGLMRPNTTVVYLESPGSLTFEVQDLPAMAKAAHAGGAKVLIDNTWASSLYCKPLTLGADVSIQAGTKYVVGHSDANLGLVAATKDSWPPVRDLARRMGLAAGPDDIYLAQRGLRTLAVRLRRHMESSLAIAEWLRSRPEITRVLHPALPGDPGHALWRRDFLGASGLFAVEMKPCGPKAVAAFLDDLELFGLGYSWGGFESLAVPARLGRTRTATNAATPGPLVRFHIGLEAVDDLKEDLAAGLARFNAAG